MKHTVEIIEAKDRHPENVQHSRYIYDVVVEIDGIPLKAEITLCWNANRVICKNYNMHWRVYFEDKTVKKHKDYNEIARQLKYAISKRYSQDLMPLYV